MPIMTNSFHQTLLTRPSIVSHPCLLIQSISNKGSGLIWCAESESDLSETAQQTLCSIPFHQCLNVGTVLGLAEYYDSLRSLVDSVVTVFGSDIEPVRWSNELEKWVLIAFLIWMNKATDSLLKSNENARFWKGYVEILPKQNEFATPVWLRDFELLKGTDLLLPTKKKREYLESCHEKWNKWLVEKRKETGYDFELSLKDVQWADSVFWSRILAFTSCTKEEGAPSNLYNYHFVPLLDFANHESYTSANAFWKLDGNAIQLVSKRPLKSREEVTICYGEKMRNDELLFLHGFIPLDNQTSMTVTHHGLPWMEEDIISEDGTVIHDNPVKCAKRDFIDLLAASFRGLSGIDRTPFTQQIAFVCISMVQDADEKDCDNIRAQLEALLGGLESYGSEKLDILHVLVISPDEGFGVEATDDGYDFYVAGRRVLTMVELHDAIVNCKEWSEFREVLLLRIVTVLLELANEHLEELSLNNIQVSQSQLDSALTTYRSQQRGCWKYIRDRLEQMKMKLVEHPNVIKYLL